jgi:hypothetical protein
LKRAAKIINGVEPEVNVRKYKEQIGVFGENEIIELYKPIHLIAGKTISLFSSIA